MGKKHKGKGRFFALCSLYCGHWVIFGDSPRSCPKLHFFPGKGRREPPFALFLAVLLVYLTVTLLLIRETTFPAESFTKPFTV